VECKRRCINFRRVSDPRRAFWLAFRVTGISDDWCGSIMGVIVMSLGTPRSAGENFECTLEGLGAPITSLGAPMRNLGALMTSLGAPTRSLGARATGLGAPQITAAQSGQNTICVGNTASALGHYSYYLLFNDFENSCIRFVFGSMDLYRYRSTNRISGLAAGSA